MDDSQQGLEHPVFGNHLVLSTILKNLCLSDLKRCRQVNSQWDIEATAILKNIYKTKEIRLRQEHLYGKDVYTASLFIRKGNQSILKTDTLKNFTKLFLNSKSKSLPFPANSFSLADGQYLTSPELQNFFWIVGSCIECLELEILYDPQWNVQGVQENPATSISPSIIDTLLTRQLPNLRRLTFLKIPDVWRNLSEKEVHVVQLLSKDSQMKCLQYLNLRLLGRLPKAFVHSLLKAAPNIREFYCDISVTENRSLVVALGKSVFS